MTYAVSAWWGYTTAADKQCLEALIRRAVRVGLYPADGPKLHQLVADMDDALFAWMQAYEQHVWQQLLPALPVINMFYAAEDMTIVLALKQTMTIVILLLVCCTRICTDFFLAISVVFDILYKLRFDNFLLNEDDDDDDDDTAVYGWTLVSRFPRQFFFLHMFHKRHYR